ncbi:MAG: tRNA(Met) cytidine acetyltransferase, partial [Candidatus Nitrosothermus koennekii]
DSWFTDFHKEFATKEDIKLRFEHRLIDHTIGKEGIIYIDDEEIIKGSIPKSTERRKLISIEGKLFYNLCITNDQVNVLRIIEEFLEYDKGAIVLKANRGRGKSAVLGLAIAGMILNYDISKILITAPEAENIQTIFEFIMKALDSKGIKYSNRMVDNLIVELKYYDKKVLYKKPLGALEEKADIIIIDEAAGISIPLLLGLMKRYHKAIYSSTIHGYEGAGRGFSIRFMNRLKKFTDVLEVSMEEPIRYAINDPIEKWLYDILLLDAEPAKIDGIKDYRYEEIDRDELFYNNEPMLREIIGLYVLTHYRNKPDDIALLADAPHHFIRAMLTDNKVVNALHLCYEGNIDVSFDTIKDIKGNMIPSVVARYYYNLKAFCKLKGVRIVRIATHPSSWNRGIGSQALEELRKEFEKKVDWLGSGFGASPDLLRFWLKNGYHVISIGPRRNPVSGEYSVIVIKPMKKHVNKILDDLIREFRLRFIDSLYDSYFNLDLQTAYLLLNDRYGNITFKPEFKGTQRLRLEAYLNDLVIYEGATDSIRVLVKAHFMNSKRLELSEEEEKLLIAKVLQGRDWINITRLMKKRLADSIDMMKNIIAKLYEYY